MGCGRVSYPAGYPDIDAFIPQKIIKTVNLYPKEKPATLKIPIPVNPVANGVRKMESDVKLKELTDDDEQNRRIVNSMYTHFRRPIPPVSIWVFFQKYIRAVVEHLGPLTEWIIDITSGIRIFYGDIEDVTKRLGSGLYKIGVRPGSVVTYYTTNMSHIYYAVMAIWRLNAAIASTYPDDVPEELARRMRETKSEFLLCDKGTESSALQAIKLLNYPVKLISFGKLDKADSTLVGDLFEDDGEGFPLGIDTDVDNRSDIVFIGSTSGTTGRCKGAAHSHFSVISGFMNGGVLRKSVGKYCIMPVRIHHISGLLWPLAALTFGKTAIVMEKIDHESIISTINNLNISHMVGFPSFIISLALKISSEGLSCPSITWLMSGGATLPPSSVEKLRMGFPNLTKIDACFGMTEIFVATSTIPPMAVEDDPDLQIDVTKMESIGRLNPFSKAKIVDTETGFNLGPNEVGEICFRSPSTMMKYVNEPEATERTMKSGWIHTGDIGYYDDKGLFFVTGRNKEVFKYWGNHVSPSELENILMEHPDVQEAAVVGLPDPNAGALPCAVVVRRPSSLVSARDLRTFVDDRVSETKKLRGGVIFMQELPKSKTGKISRKDVLNFVMNWT